MKLDKGQQSEYNTILTASMLRDVFRYSDQLGENFFGFEDFSGFISKNNIDIDLKLLEMLLLKKGSNGSDVGESNVEIDDDKKRALEAIISRASFTSIQDSPDFRAKSSEKKGENRLQSIFSFLKTTERPLQTPGYYQLRPLAPDTIFPVSKDKLDLGEFDYDNLCSEFSRILKNFEAHDFNELFNGYWNLFRKYLWAVPLANSEDSASLSLFDHLSLTSSAAASLYLYHNYHNSMNEKSINDDTEKFLFVGGDLSGIQQFIFEIEQRNPKKLSKTLRGRSFLLGLLVEIVSLKILTELNLPFSAKIMSSGGRFLILAPNTGHTTKRMDELKLEIEEEFFKFFSGKVTFILDYSITLNPEDFIKADVKKKISNVNIKLNELKLKKNYLLIKSENPGKYLEDCYEKLIKNKVCNFCGVYPAVTIETEGENEYRKCDICELAEKTGYNIVTKNYIQFKKNGKSDFFNFLGIGVEFADKPGKSLLTYSIKEGKGNNRGSIDFSISNYLPRDYGYIEYDNNDSNKLCYSCQRNDLSTQCEKDTRKDFKNTHLSFQCIASYSPYDNEGKGVDKLAVFKADIDNLGYILQEGLPGDKYSLSRFTFLSRMLDLFFQDWLKKVIKEYELEVKKKFNMIYTVYSGGDDLLLIGPWFNIIEFAHFFRKKFRAFTGFNPDITFSAGIALFSPHSPVTIAVERAEEYLEMSKNSEGKNSLTLFDTTIKWEKLKKLLDFAEFLDKSIRTRDEESGIKIGFLHRLFKYRRMFMEAEEERKVEGLRFHSLMNYDITRNIKIKETKKKLEPLFIAGDNLDKELWRNLKIPLYIALYKNRGGK